MERNIRQRATLHQLSTGKSPFKLFEWGGGDKKILLVHGWSGRATQFFIIIEALLEDGYRVFSIEAPAHGETEQRRTHMLEFVEAANVVNRDFGPFRFAIGHSLGGMAIFNAMKDSSFSPEAVAVIGSPASIDNVVGDFCRKVEDSPEVGRRIISYIENRYDLKVSEASTDFLAEQFDPEGIIIHNEDDHDVGIENAKEIKEHWSKAETVLTKGLGHRKILMDQEIIDKLISFFSQF